MSTQPIRVLVVENNESIAQYFLEVLSTSASPTFDPAWVKSLADASQAINKQAPDVILLDLVLPDSKGEHTIEAIQQVSGSRLPIIVLTDTVESNISLERLKNGAQDFLEKSSCGLDLLTRTILFSIERKKLEMRLQAQSEVLANVLTNIPYRVFWKDIDSNYLGCNELFSKSSGLSTPEKIVGKSDYDLAWTREESDSYRQCDRQVMSEDVQIINLEETQKQGDGSELTVLTSKVPLKNPNGETIGVLGIYADITERKLAEQKALENTRQLEEANTKLIASQQQLIQSEKMASIGQLAAGVAHDINNPVGFVMSNLGSLTDYVGILQSLLEQYGELTNGIDAKLSKEGTKLLQKINAFKDEEDLEYILEDTQQLLTESLDGVNRIKDIVLSLKSFARLGDEPVEDVDINAGIETTFKIVGNELKYTCQVNKDMGELPPLCCIPGQLNQVFMNLLVNAGHAIEERGEIHIKTWTDQEHIYVRISDTGKGIPEEHLSRIFDPFFTTKPVGQGTGLGLSVSYGIVQKHGGSIEVISDVGKGTQFTVVLPVSGIPKEAEDLLKEGVTEISADGEKEHANSIS